MQHKTCPEISASRSKYNMQINEANWAKLTLQIKVTTTNLLIPVMARED